MIYPTELTQTYEIYEQIGAGGGGTVYRAVHKRLKKTVVIKKLKAQMLLFIQIIITRILISIQYLCLLMKVAIFVLTIL